MTSGWIKSSLPRVLEFPGTKQTSISVERALKNARAMIIHLLPATGEVSNPAIQDRINVALDDLQLMLGAIE